MKNKNFLHLFILALVITTGCSKGIKIETYSTDLGKVNGVAFDKSGNLFATGTSDKANVIWKVTPNGNKEVFSIVTDAGDVLSALGISNHSEKMAQITVDSAGKLWVSSMRHAGSFVVTPDGKTTKVYLNNRMSISFQEGMEYPYGCVYNPETDKVYIVTSGPKRDYSTDNYHFINNITPAEDKLCEELKMIKDTGHHDVATIANKGISLEGPSHGLINGKNSQLYVIGKDSLFEVVEGKEIKKVNVDFGDVSLWAGAVDEKGNIYLTTNVKDYSPDESKETKGSILKLSPDKAVSVFTRNVGQPLGIAYRDGSLYVADRLSGTVLRINLNN